MHVMAGFTIGQQRPQIEAPKRRIEPDIVPAPECRIDVLMMTRQPRTQVGVQIGVARDCDTAHRQVLDAEHRTGQIRIHDAAGFEGMRVAGKLAAECLDLLTPHVVPGAVTTPLVQTVQIAGVDRDDPQVQRWVARFAGHAVSPEQAADKLLSGVAKNRFMIYTSPDIRALYLFKRLAWWPYSVSMRQVNVLFTRALRPKRSE